MATKFIQYLLDLLKEGLHAVEQSSACKAHVVKALKAMTMYVLLLSLTEEELTLCTLQRPCTRRGCCQHIGTLPVVGDVQRCVRAHLSLLEWVVKAQAVRSLALPQHCVLADQKHDLFISSTPVAGYLTGPTATVAGYLTVGQLTASGSIHLTSLVHAPFVGCPSCVCGYRHGPS